MIHREGVRKVVLDTNVFLVSIPTKSRYHPIFTALVKGDYLLLITNEIMTEYYEILQQKANEAVANAALAMLHLSPSVVFSDVYFRWNLISDPDDNKFADCAISGNAQYLVTNDRHFDVLKNLEFPQVKVITAADFLEIIRAESESSTSASCTIFK